MCRFSDPDTHFSPRFNISGLPAPAAGITFRKNRVMKKWYISSLFFFSALHLLAQYPLVSIHDLQYKDDAALASGDDVSAYDGDTVRVQGIVMFDPCDYALSNTGARMGTFLADPDGGVWNGIHVLIDSGAIVFDGDLQALNDATLFVDNFQVGNIVECTGIINAFDENTQLVLLPVPTEIIGFASLPDPELTDISDFEQSDGAGGQTQQSVTGEPYEGVLVEMDNAVVTDVASYPGDPTRWIWYVQDGSGNKIPIRDLSGWLRNGTNDDLCNYWSTGVSGVSNTPDPFTPPVIGTNLSYIRGEIVEYTISGLPYYGLAVRDLSDIGPATASPPTVSNVHRDPVVASPDDDVTISATINDIDGTIASSVLYYSYGYGNASFTAVSMTNTGGSTWEGTVPGPGTDSTYINYYFHPTDNDGNSIDYPSVSSPLEYIVYADGINSIVQIQNTPLPNGNSIWANDSIPDMYIEATVTATTATYDLGIVAVQEGENPYQGIFIQSVPGDNTDHLFRGDKILITSAKVVEDFSVTKLKYVQYTLESQFNPLPAFKTGLDPLMVDGGDYASTEPWEGMLVKFDNQYVTSNNADAGTGGAFGEWRVNSSNTPESGMRCDDYSYDIDFNFGTDSLTLGDELGFIQGIMYYSFGEWKLIPRDRNDIDGYSEMYPNSIISFNFDGLTPPVTGSIDQGAHTISLEVPPGTDLTNLAPGISISGQYVDPPPGMSNDFTAPVDYTCYSPVSYTPNTYTVTVTYGSAIPQNPGLSGVSVYPVPSNDNLTLEFYADMTDMISLSLKDLEGREILKFSKLCASGKNIFPIDLKAVPNGLYLLQIRSSHGIMTQKVEVSR